MTRLSDEQIRAMVERLPYCDVGAFESLADEAIERGKERDAEVRKHSKTAQDLLETVKRVREAEQERDEAWAKLDKALTLGETTVVQRDTSAQQVKVLRELATDLWNACRFVSNYECEHGFMLDECPNENCEEASLHRRFLAATQQEGV